MSLVLDASVMMAWLNKAETTPAVTAVFDYLVHEVAWVPSLWWLEITNAAQIGYRRKRYTAIERDTYLKAVANYTVLTDSGSAENVPWTVLTLSDRHGLTLYDAAYLELAMRRRLSLATLNRELRQAAEAEQVTLLGM